MLPYEMKFLVPNYSCLQNPWLGGYRPPDPRFLCPLSSTEFVEPPLPQKKKKSWLRHCVCLRFYLILWWHESFKTCKWKIKLSNSLSKTQTHSYSNNISNTTYRYIISLCAILVIFLHCTTSVYFVFFMAYFTSHYDFH